MSNTNKPPMSFMAACRDFFGVLPGQTALQFGQEVKALTDKDRADLIAMLTAKGYTIQQAAA